MNNNYENLPAVLNANQLAAALGISRAGAYQLLNTGTFPTLRIGKRLLVPKDKLIDWIEQNTGWPPSFIRLLMSMSRLSSLAVSFSDIPVCFCVVGEVVVFEEGRRGPEVVMVHQLDVHLEISEFVVAGVEPWQYGVVVVNPPRRGIVDVKVSPSAALHEHVALAGHDFYVGILVQLLVHLLLGRGGKVERGALLLHDLEHADVRPSSLAGGKGHLNV